jgi:hypothetical protein
LGTQDELSERINEKMTVARQSILENFDAEVAALLKNCNDKTLAGLDKFSRWLCGFFVAWGSPEVKELEAARFEYGCKIYNAKWQNAEAKGEIFLRREICEDYLREAQTKPLPSSSLCFHYTDSGRHIGFLESHPNLQGILSVDKLIYTGFETEEHIVLSVVTSDGTEVDDDMMNQILELPAAVTGECFDEPPALAERRNSGIAARRLQIEEANKMYFLEECEKLDAYSEDLKEGLQRELKELRREISEKKKLFRVMEDTSPLAEILAMRDELNRLEEKQKKMRREIYDREDEIEAKNARLQDEIKARMGGSTQMEHIMTFSFEIA